MRERKFEWYCSNCCIQIVVMSLIWRTETIDSLYSSQIVHFPLVSGYCNDLIIVFFSGWNSQNVFRQFCVWFFFSFFCSYYLKLIQFVSHSQWNGAHSSNMLFIRFSLTRFFRRPIEFNEQKVKYMKISAHSRHRNWSIS